MGNTSKETAETRKAYKKAKKKRRILKKAEQKREIEQQRIRSNNDVTGKPSSLSGNSMDTSTKWRRVGKKDGAKKAVDRPLDDDYSVEKINELLEKRSKAKEEKNYTVSDEVTKTLVELQIVYNDDKREWHTRILKNKD
eukprot:CAMPEP_0194367458 /NCGR_PEP_ID=MMETSP0174-20130528/15549_1 /TAXON_ID=216777 /ORGANISM="Proboscia alata, Strain PI-D3" /LENGTH=138 /DNA_ID=CAMNT_0039143219 /DNA_START=6 /DNA_END=422 /DNA_ORIENTATION=-